MAVMSARDVERYVGRDEAMDVLECYVRGHGQRD